MVQTFGTLRELLRSDSTDPAATDVARAMLSHPKVRAVRVTTEKPDVYPDCDSVGVEVIHIKA